MPRHENSHFDTSSEPAATLPRRDILPVQGVLLFPFARVSELAHEDSSLLGRIPFFEPKRLLGKESGSVQLDVRRAIVIRHLAGP